MSDRDITEQLYNFPSKSEQQWVVLQLARDEIRRLREHKEYRDSEIERLRTELESTRAALTAERERCAGIADSIAIQENSGAMAYDDPHCEGGAEAAERIAAAIRSGEPISPPADPDNNPPKSPAASTSTASKPRA